MQTLFTILGVFVCLYLLAGVIMATYEKTQTDNKFDWKTIFTWLYKIFS